MRALKPAPRLSLISYNAPFPSICCINPRFPEGRDRQNRSMLKNRQSMAKSAKRGRSAYRRLSDSGGRFVKSVDMCYVPVFSSGDHRLCLGRVRPKLAGHFGAVVQQQVELRSRPRALAMPTRPKAPLSPSTIARSPRSRSRQVKRTMSPRIPTGLTLLY
jgi:hypothetical protein